MADTKKKNKARTKAQIGTENANQGLLGQDLFSLWATRAGVSANPATKDLSGWDFLVDLPQDAVNALPATCKVQVKTLAEGEASAQLKLSNCRRMLMEAIPWFVILVRLGADKEAKEVRLLTVEGRLIPQMVKALANKKSAAKKKALNQRRLKLKVADAQTIVTGPPFDGTLFAAMRAAIGDQLAHVIAKQAALKSAQRAHPESEGSFSVRFESRDATLRAMAEFAVGIRPQLPVERFTLSERFLGMDGGTNTQKGTSTTTLELPALPSLGKTRVIVSHPSRSTRVERHFETHLAKTVFPFLPPAHSLVRLVSPHLALVFEPASSTFRFHLSVDLLKSSGSIPARELGEVSEFFLELISPTEAGARIAFHFPNSESPSTLDPKSRSLDVSDDLKQALASFRDAWRILDRLHLGDDIVMPEELEARSRMIGICSETLAGRPPEMEVSFAIPETDVAAVAGKRVSITFVPGFKTAQHAVLVVLALTGVPSGIAGSPDRVALPLGKPEVLLTEIHDLKDLQVQDTLVALRAKAGLLLEKRGVTEIVHLE